MSKARARRVIQVAFPDPVDLSERLLPGALLLAEDGIVERLGPRTFRYVVPFLATWGEPLDDLRSIHGHAKPVVGPGDVEYASVDDAALRGGYSHKTIRKLISRPDSDWKWKNPC